VATNFPFTLTERAKFWTKSPEMATGSQSGRGAGFQRVRCYSSWICASAGFSGHFVHKFAGKKSAVRAARDDVLTRPINSNLGLNGEVVRAASSGMRETCPI
jgi:hypothetical protein